MTAVVLLGHGSPDPRSAAGVRALARAVARTRPDLHVEVAFLDHDDPALAGVALELAWAGHEEAVVVPLFLSEAHHVRVDVPRAAEVAERSSGLRLHVARPIGPDAALIPLLDQGLPVGGPVVLAAAGTRDAAAQASILTLAEEWSALRGAPVTVAYAAMAEPALGMVLDAAVRRGEHPAVAPYVLFPGTLPERIADEASERGLACGSPLGNAVVALVAERIAEVTALVG